MSVTRLRCDSWSRAASCCASAASAATPCRRSTSRPASRCSWIELVSTVRASSSTTRPWRPSARSPSGSGGCRSRWSSPRRAPACCRRRRSATASAHSLDLRGRRPRPAGATADPASRDRLERRAPRGARASPVRQAQRLRRRLDRDDRGAGRRIPPEILGIDIVDGLESLADKSLIRIEPAPGGAAEEDAETRFSLHPLLREYAYERLGERWAGCARRKARSPRNAWASR